ncbi:MAG: dockerin type I repeat-containing protein [Bacteroidota bacterium]
MIISKIDKAIWLSRGFIIFSFFFPGSFCGVASNQFRSDSTDSKYSGKATNVRFNHLGGSLTNYGTVEIKKNLNNQSGMATDLGPGAYIFSGTTAQSITGSVTFQNFTLNNLQGVSTTADVQINGIFTLTAGKFTLGSNNLKLGESSSIAGVQSASAMVVATGTGELRKSFPVSPSFPLAFTYPVGDASGTAEYSPVTVSFTSGTFGSGNYLGVNLQNESDPNLGAPSGDYLKRYWTLSNSNIAGSISSDITFIFTDADVTGLKSNLYCIKTSPGFTEYSGYLINNQLKGTVSSFSRFTGANQLVKTNLKLFLEGLYNPATGQMNKAKDYINGSYTDKYTGTIADLITVVLHNGGNYLTLVDSSTGVELHQDGTAVFNLPGSYKGSSFYTVVKQRNHIETVSISPVSYSTNNVSYDFSASDANAFGNNQKLLATGVYGIFTGDANQDGIVNLLDLSSVNSAVLSLLKGYIATDLNGDGVINLLDLSTVNSAVLNIVSRKTP